ncbi:MAG: hypothetical protein ACF8XB_05085 [Planctomycetota bacterium JB042]
MLRPPLVVSLSLLLSFLLAACERDAAEREVPVRPPVVLDEETMTRLLAAMRELQDLSRSHPMAQASERGVMPVGPLMVTFLGDRAEAVIKRHGFSNATEFEGKLGYVQAALQQLQFEGRHGFDGDMQLYRLRGKRTDLEARRKEIEQDAELSDDTRRLMLAEVRLQLEDVEERIEDVNAFAATMERQFETLPDENLESVRRHLDEILALIAPEGTLLSAPPGTGTPAGASDG